MHGYRTLRGGKLDEEVLALADNAKDAIVYDAAYTSEEYPKFKGWGHSTWEEAIKIADAANVKNTLLLFHHDPSHGDKKMDEIAEKHIPLILQSDQQLKEVRINFLITGLRTAKNCIVLFRS